MDEMAHNILELNCFGSIPRSDILQLPLLLSGGSEEEGSCSRTDSQEYSNCQEFNAVPSSVPPNKTSELNSGGSGEEGSCSPTDSEEFTDCQEFNTVPSSVPPRVGQTSELHSGGSGEEGSCSSTNSQEYTDSQGFNTIPSSVPPRIRQMFELDLHYFDSVPRSNPPHVTQLTGSNINNLQLSTFSPPLNQLASCNEDSPSWKQPAGSSKEVEASEHSDSNSDNELLNRVSMFMLVEASRETDGGFAAFPSDLLENSNGSNTTTEGVSMFPTHLNFFVHRSSTLPPNAADPVKQHSGVLPNVLETLQRETFQLRGVNSTTPDRISVVIGGTTIDSDSSTVVISRANRKEPKGIAKPKAKDARGKSKPN